MRYLVIGYMLAILVIVAISLLSYIGVQPIGSYVDSIRSGINKLLKRFDVGNYSIDVSPTSGFSCTREGNLIRCSGKYQGSPVLLGYIFIQTTENVDVYILASGNGVSVTFSVSLCQYAICYNVARGSNSIKFSIAPTMEYYGAPWEVPNVTVVYSKVYVSAYVYGDVSGDVDITISIDVRPRVY